MKTIKIVKEIDCNDFSCGDCEYSDSAIISPRVLCQLFSKVLKVTRENSLIRCHECLEAEVSE